MASSLLQLLFNTADTIVVGRFAGDAALAADGCYGRLRAWTWLFYHAYYHHTVWRHWNPNCVDHDLLPSGSVPFGKIPLPDISSELAPYLYPASDFAEDRLEKSML